MSVELVQIIRNALRSGWVRVMLVATVLTLIGGGLAVGLAWPEVRWAGLANDIMWKGGTLILGLWLLAEIVARSEGPGIVNGLRRQFFAQIQSSTETARRVLLQQEQTGTSSLFDYALAEGVWRSASPELRAGYLERWRYFQEERTFAAWYQWREPMPGETQLPAGVIVSVWQFGHAVRVGVFFQQRFMAVLPPGAEERLQAAAASFFTCDPGQLVRTGRGDFSLLDYHLPAGSPLTDRFLQDELIVCFTHLFQGLALAVYEELHRPGRED